MGPSMDANLSAAVLKVVTRLTTDSGAGSRGRSGPGTGTGIGSHLCLSNSLIPSSRIFQCLICFVHQALLLCQHSLQLGLVVLSM